MKGNWVKGGLAVSAIAIVMGVTNPKQESYLNYASDKLTESAGESICQQTGYCQLADPPIFIKNTIIKPVIHSATKRQNFIVFSIYTTEFTGIKTLKTIGILGNFYTYSG